MPQEALVMLLAAAFGQYRARQRKLPHLQHERRLLLTEETEGARKLADQIERPVDDAMLTRAADELESGLLPLATAKSVVSGVIRAEFDESKVSRDHAGKFAPGGGDGGGEADKQDKPAPEKKPESAGTAPGHGAVETPSDTIKIITDPTAKVAKATALGGGHINAAFKTVLRTADGREVTVNFKPRAGEMGVKDNIPGGHYAEREEAASRVAEIIGMDNVPNARVRDIGPQSPKADEGCEGVGAAIEWRDPLRFISHYGSNPENSARALWDKAGRAEADKFLAFDYIIGHCDRHGNNIAFYEDPKSGKLRPWLFDNGISFPEDAKRSEPREAGGVFNSGLYAGSPMGPASRQWIDAIEPKKVAIVVKRAGLSREVARHALRRLAALKEDPNFLTKGYHAANAKMREETQGLDPVALRRVNTIITNVYRSHPRRGDR